MTNRDALEERIRTAVTLIAEDYPEAYQLVCLQLGPLVMRWDEISDAQLLEISMAADKLLLILDARVVHSSLI